MEKERLNRIRAAERDSHLAVYSRNDLFEPGSWLAKPVKTLLDLLPLLEDRQDFRALDLGCGVGRNSMAVARQGRVDCVDILPYAIEKLQENAVRYGVRDRIYGIVSAIDNYVIAPEEYDLILAVSALEHVNSPETFEKKLSEIHAGVRKRGIVCLIVNSGIRERDKETGAILEPQFEVNLSTKQLQSLLADIFWDWEVLRQTVVHQKYEIPRETGTAELETDVITFAARKK